MRHVLRWSLGATVALSAAALWWPQRQAAVVAAVTRGTNEPAPAADISRMTDDPASQLPAKVVPLEIEPARRDPFVPVEPPLKPATAPPPQPPSPPPVMQAPPPPAPPPAPQLRYFGFMVAPDGKRVTMLAAGDQALPVQVGMTLAGAYVVQAISANAVTLTHPPTGTRFDVAIPDPDSKSR